METLDSQINSNDDHFRGLYLIVVCKQGGNCAAHDGDHYQNGDDGRRAVASIIGYNGLTPAKKGIKTT